MSNYPVSDTGDITWWHHAARGRKDGWSSAPSRRTAAGRYMMAVRNYNQSRPSSEWVHLDDSIVHWVNGYDAAVAAYETGLVTPERRHSNG